MRTILSDTIGRLRLLAFLEGLSLLVLLIIAMPLKYMLHKPAMVQVTGSIHGALFVLYVLYTFYAAHKYGWRFWKTTWWLQLASFLPFGTFYADSKFLAHEQKRLRNRENSAAGSGST